MFPAKSLATLAAFQVWAKCGHHARIPLLARRPSIHSLFVVLFVPAAVGSLSLVCSALLAAEERIVYLPMAFHVEARAHSTSACLQVTERVYPQSAWWEEADGDADPYEESFRKVIDAIKRQDRAAFFELSHSEQRRYRDRVEEQADAFFKQFEVVDLVAVPRGYEFDGLVMLFSSMQYKERTFAFPFLFAYEDHGALGFLPYRTRQWTYQLVVDSLDSMLEPAATDHPRFCTEDVIRRATHEVPLVSSSLSAEGRTHRPLTLFLRGVSLETRGGGTELVTRVEATIKKMHSLLREEEIDDFVECLTPEGGNRLKEWFTSADEAERNKYRRHYTEQKPFFLFDASPLLVVYTRSPDGVVLVMHFTFNANGELLWTNSSRVTVTDNIFKKGLLYEAAALDEPFSSVAIK